MPDYLREGDTSSSWSSPASAAASPTCCPWSASCVAAGSDSPRRTRTSTPPPQAAAWSSTSSPCWPEFIRELITEGTREGLAAVRANGVRLGRPPALPEPAPIACTLTAENQAARIAQWRQLLAGAERENVDDGLLFRLPTERAGPVAELAAAEQRCCAFFKFAVRLRDGRVELKVHASPDAAPLLAEVFGTTD